jgi:ABC-type phosphate transport system substrate-binding protein
VALCALYATLGGPVSAAPHLSAQATPATNLGDQVINVTWEGFGPTRADGTDSVVIMQCRANPRSVLNDCNTADTFPYDLNGNQQAGTTAKNGTGRVFIDIMTTARLPSLACSQTTPCSLLVYETTANGFDANGLPPASTRVIVPLSFARNSADCPPVREYDFKVESEASAAPALYQWAAALCTGPHAFAMDITNTSSNQARQDFLSNLVDLGVTSLAPEPGELTPTSPKFSVVPLDLTAVVIAYNITDPVTHKQITNLTLTPRLVARLLSDSNIESFFSDPELQKLNPGHHWPIQAADPGLRGEKNADTWLVTNWVNANPAARAFLDGKDPYHVPVNPSWLNVTYPTDVFAARNSNGVYFPRIGEEGVAQRLFADTKPADSVPTDTLDAGEIGILDYPTAVRFKLPVANLTTGVGQPVVAANPFSIAAAYPAMQTSPAGFHVEPPVVSGANVYPLAKVDQAMVPPKLTTSAKDLRIRAFLDYAVGPGQANLPAGYVPIPSALELQTLDYTGDRPQPTTTTTPTTSSVGSSLGALANRVTPFDNSAGYGGTSTETLPATKPAHTTLPTSTPTPATTAGTARARFVALRLSDSGDHLVFPIVLGLGLAAVVAASTDGVRRHGRTWWRRVRRPTPPLGGQSAP